MSSLSLAGISNEELLTRTPTLKGEENQIIADVVLHLGEIDKRGIYRDAGHSSLFAYCTRRLGYSEGAAARRVQAARKLKDAPELYDLIRTGAISLSALSEVAPVMTEENTAEVLTLVQGASKREAEKIAVQFGAVEKTKKESIRIKKVRVGNPGSVKQPIGDLFTMLESTPPAERSLEPEVKTEVRYSYSFEANEEFQAVLEQAQAITGVSGVAEVIQKALRLLVEKRRPKAGKKPKAEGKIVKPEAEVSVMTEAPLQAVTQAEPQKAEKLYGPLRQSVRREVFERDGECCAYVSPEGVRCCERRFLQVDYVLPVARGGTNELENLRIYCAPHNQLLAEQWMGREFIEKKREGRGASSTTVPA